AVLRAAIDDVRGVLDHRLLNDIEELGAPTIENLARYLFEYLSRKITGVSQITVTRRASGDRCTLASAPSD
ncbi:MAG TPA: 6-carboxytetrahydropterin synthase, partial [Steroidobacteraceae bacterium]|nr:6-carboxytetrahydropterin synthase [Steroidobacteraceae bacterium]